MKKLNILFLVIIMTLSLLACQDPHATYTASEDSPPPNEVYLGLRNIWLSTPPDEMEIDFIDGSKIPYAVIMDMSFDDGSATIVSSILGDGSLYTSTGGGIIGGIEYKNVRNASIQFVEISTSFVDKMELVQEYPVPLANYIQFYLVTPNGVYATSEVDADLLASGNHELSPLFLAGNDVITALRESSE